MVAAGLAWAACGRVVAAEVDPASTPWPVGVGIALGLVAVGFWALKARRPRANPQRRLTDRQRAPGSLLFASTQRDSTADTAMDPRHMEPPRRIGHYIVERDIGRGAMGMVLQCRDERNGEAVAVKMMALGREFHGEALDEARERFFREADMASRLQYPDIVAVREVGEDAGMAYIAMELLAGRDLSEFAQPDRLMPVPQVLEIVARVAHALAYAHRQGVTHRDIKPANIMVDPVMGTVKVTDFGIARITDATQTRTGLLLGTPSFMSPEQMAGARVDGRSDLYSLGVTLFQLLTGTLPHRCESMSTLIRSIANDTAPDVRSKRPELAQELAEVVALALEKHPDARYADGDAMASDLRTVAAMMAAAPPPAVAGPAAAADGASMTPSPGAGAGAQPGHNP